jgi:hypothetical protein
MAKTGSAANFPSFAVSSAIVPGAALAPACAQGVKPKATDRLPPPDFPANYVAQPGAGAVR